MPRITPTPLQLGLQGARGRTKQATPVLSTRELRAPTREGEGARTPRPLQGVRISKTRIKLVYMSMGNRWVESQDRNL